MKSKPSNLRYTQLCMYIDDAVYNRDENNNPTSLKDLSEEQQQKVYTYLCNIIVALAHVKKLFSSWDDYEEFSYTCATDIFVRLMDRNQDFSENPKGLKPIKSILNYIKGCIGFIAIKYRNNNFSQILNPEFDGEDACNAVNEYMEHSVRSDYERPVSSIFKQYIENINEYIDKAIEEGKRFNVNPIMKNALSLSIKLSIRNFITLPDSCSNMTDGRRQRDTWKSISS